MKKSLWLSLCCAVMLVVSACGSPTETPKEENNNGGKTEQTVYNGDKQGLVLKGYDAVAYFNDKKAVKGDAQFKLEWSGATWHFASAANRDAFKASPEKYAPQYGSFCAWAMARNQKADVDPNSWKVVDGKLYLNYDKKTQELWEADVPGFIKKADGYWPEQRAKK